MLLSALQFPVAKYLYDPFGNTLSSSGPRTACTFASNSETLSVLGGLGLAMGG